MAEVERVEVGDIPFVRVGCGATVGVSIGVEESDRQKEIRGGRHER